MSTIVLAAAFLVLYGLGFILGYHYRKHRKSVPVLNSSDVINSFIDVLKQHSDKKVTGVKVIIEFENEGGKVNKMEVN